MKHKNVNWRTVLSIGDEVFYRNVWREILNFDDDLGMNVSGIGWMCRSLLEVCSQCGQDHFNQIKDYPQGATVEVIDGFYGSIDPVKYDILNDINQCIPIEEGTTGKVIAHCDDGRAIVEFEADNEKTSHTFHYPDGYIKVIEKNYGYLDALNDLADIQFIDNTIQEAEEAKAEVVKIIQGLCGVYDD